MPSDRPTISFELYPPRSEKGERVLVRTLAELAAAQPDFFSITYGASGSTRETSRELIRRVVTETEVTPIAHLTCVGASEEELRGVIEDLLDEGVRDFLALRGDPPAGQPDWEPHPQGLTRSSQLVRLLRSIEAERFGDAGATTGQVNPLSISVATYPGALRDKTGNPVVDPRDIAALVEKQEAGADFAITQIFYDAGHYAALLEQARSAGVHIPILPGVIPLTDPRRLRKLHQLTGVRPPEELLATLDGAASKQEAYRLGLRATRSLVNDILALGAPGLHVYTFNTATPALDLLYGSGLRPVPTLA
ncbi:methylenetetrahydrofolate reductase [Pseudactinotalea sp. Z1748]|uniref:methylenetetrahydrofolate reductase n=1 Tax=Pseudactinotalea sp. Z1748 TaxID=3413027 RepID=UPI003C7BE916